MKQRIFLLARKFFLKQSATIKAPKHSLSNILQSGAVPTRCFTMSGHRLNDKYKFESMDDLLNENKNKDEKNQEDNKNPEQKVGLKTRLAILTTLSTFVGGFWYYLKTTTEKKQLLKQEEECTKVDIGKSGFNLINHKGEKKTKEDFMGKWLLLYFGFTHCPDICPEELEKITDIVSAINEDNKLPDLQPVFVSVDPRRDTPEAMSEYLKDFHPTFVGLTGTEEEIEAAAKSYRVYYSVGPIDADEDYIVDHSMNMYLMNPRGDFVDFYGSRSKGTAEVCNGITRRMNNFIRLHG